MKSILLVLLNGIILSALTTLSHADDALPPQGKEIIYKHTQGKPQALEVFFPEDHAPEQLRLDVDAHPFGRIVVIRQVIGDQGTQCDAVDDFPTHVLKIMKSSIS